METSAPPVVPVREPTPPLRKASSLPSVLINDNQLENASHLSGSDAASDSASSRDMADEPAAAVVAARRKSELLHRASSEHALNFVEREHLQRIDVLGSRAVFEELAETVWVTNREGLRLKASVLRSANADAKLMFLCAPLGTNGMYSYRPLIARFGGDFTFVSWCYRGLHESDAPDKLRRMSIRDHAEDALDVLRGTGFEFADVLVGHSMGVQVGLEFTLLNPERVGALLMMNGGHGTVFNTAFQPFMRIPFVDKASGWLVRQILTHKPQRLLSWLHYGLTNPISERVVTALSPYVGTQTWRDIQGENYINEIINRYLGGVSSNERTSKMYLRCFQELHAHSVYHLLHTIDHPALFLSGRFDYLIPAYQSAEMAQAMPHAEHHMDWLSSHFTIVEHPDFVLSHAEKFIEGLRARDRKPRRHPSCLMPKAAYAHFMNEDADEEEDMLQT